MTARERAKANALGLRANGLSIRQIAERLGVAHGTVADWLRGRGEWFEVRECQLCGDRFVAASGVQRFCSAAYAAKYRRVLGPGERRGDRVGWVRREWVGEYVIPAERWRDPGANTRRMDLKLKPASRQVLRTVVMELGRRAGIHAHLTPHSMRHAFGDHVTRHAGIKNAQALLGHADVGTTQMYTGAPTLDELAAAIEGYRFGVKRTDVPIDPRKPLEAPTGIEPVYTALQAAA
jgi:transcriptional regulator with XRE-family HTH domain